MLIPDLPPIDQFVSLHYIFLSPSTIFWAAKQISKQEIIISYEQIRLIMVTEW